MMSVGIEVYEDSIQRREVRKANLEEQIFCQRKVRGNCPEFSIKR